MLAVAAVAARRDGNHVGGVAAGAQDRSAVAPRRRRAHDVGPRARARVAAADVDIAGAADGDAVVGVARNNMLIVASRNGGRQSGHDDGGGGSNVDH